MLYLVIQLQLVLCGGGGGGVSRWVSFPASALSICWFICRRHAVVMLICVGTSCAECASLYKTLK